MKTIIISIVLTSCFLYGCHTLENTYSNPAQNGPSETFILAQIDSISSFKEGHSIFFTPIGIYSMNHFEVTPKENGLNAPATIHKKLVEKKFYQGKMEMLVKAELKQGITLYFENQKIKRKDIRNNNIYLLCINYNLSSDNELIIKFFVEPEEIDLTTLKRLDEGSCYNQ